MESNKVEEDIKEKLESRKIQPSKLAWNKLSKELDEQDQNKSNKSYWWLGIAASIIGVLFVVSQFWSNQNNVETLPILVDTPQVLYQDSIAKIVTSDDAKVKEGVFESKKLNTTNITEQLKPKKTNRINTAIADVGTEKAFKQFNNVTLKPTKVIKEKLSFKEEQIQDVVAEVQSIKNENKIVTDADIDAMLKQAQKEIRLNTLINTNTGLVDADALLKDVESDLDESFRRKVFEAIKSSYNSVKTSVAQRNN